MTFIWTAKNFLKKDYASIMIQKVRKRLFEWQNKKHIQFNRAWCKEVAQDFGLLAQQIDPVLWQECRDFEKELLAHAGVVLPKIKFDLGGGGHYPLLYFITRRFHPGVVVETGVASGYSSQAFLKAMQVNGRGQLYSSDFPYFRYRNPEQYIGILVEERLRSGWHLYIRGDKINLPQITNKVSKIDIFHYDSDKSYSGRQFAMRILEKFLHKDSIVVMDDIQDNLFFYEFVKNKSCQWKVFNFHNKYLGLIGRL
jgi:predicted O-methyltransferase YrrM